MNKATAKHVLLALVLIVSGHALADVKARPTTQSTPQSEENNSPTVEDKAIPDTQSADAAIQQSGDNNSSTKELDSAITNFSKAIDLDNNLIAAYLDRGKTYQPMGKYDEALADFKKVLELENELAKQAIAEIEAMGKND